MFDARERDLQRYYQPWLDAQTLVHASDGLSKQGLDGYQPQGSRDKALTAFAQLAALRLDARRAMVSLVDETKQYILAEATRTLSLFSHNADVAEDQIWLGNTILARADAVCHHTFTSSYTARDENGNAYTADCLVVPDCREDPRFADKDYVTSEPGVRFYAGVPITTRLGHQIGVYAVSDDRPRKGMSISDLKFMQDVAATVMEHLELAKDSNDRVKGERMVRGLTDFIERSCSLGSKHETSKKSTTMEKQTENARLEALADEVPAIAATVPAKQPQRKQDSERGVDTSRIFTRAARIIRQSTLADGVVFFDTSAAGISGHVYENCSPLVSSDEDTNQTTTDFDAVDSTATIRRRKKLVKSFRPSTKASSHIDDVESSQHPSGVPLATDTKACPLVAISLQSDDPAPLQSDLSFTEAAMARYILRYPYGKFFNFNEEGTGFNSSDDKSEKSETECSDNHNTEAPSIKRPRKKKSKFTPDELLRIVPNIRSLIFLPLYDPTSENWVAGGFIWSTQPGRLLSPENELPYLRAFGNSITSEISRATAQKSDRAKTTFIASISHELRSPLHGILGSVEFLHDAVSSAYQKTLVSSIETCGKTLLDTIDHVLDYAKINKLRDADSRRKQRPEGRHRRLPGDNSILGVTTDFNLAQLVEEVCETVCAGETFRSTHQLHDGAFHEHVDTAQSNRIQGDASSEPTEPQSRVAVTLRVAPFVNWMVRSQPGAMRRIVMNLLGNSMKYTTSGFITISLLQEEGKSQFVEFTLSVEDSGKGMSSEYQRTKLFAPFSQEDSFSSGTGLGLSIVKQIVDSLNGKIEVQSTVDVGTNAQVVLRLPAGESQNSRASQTLIQAPEALKKKSASTVFPPKSLGGGGQKVKESMRQACEGFGMQTSDTFDLTVAQPDFLLTEPVSLDTILTEQATTKPHMPPLAVICTCTDLTEKRTIESHISRQFAALGWIVEVVTQPCGPRKLALALLDCQSRSTNEGIQRSLTRSSSNYPSQTSPPPGPQALVHRSMSDMAMEIQVAANAVAEVHSPLISATMQIPSPLSMPGLDAAKQDTPTSQAQPNEYFTPRVLLVDDNAINLKLLVVFAKRQKLVYREAMNGLEALTEYKKMAATCESTAPSTPPPKAFDFVLMDLSMPVMDGLESTRQIRQYETDNKAPRSTIIALTGLASAQDQQDAVDAGVDMYLVKPVKFADIKRIFGGAN